ncbi:MAG: hypothetical protein JWO94_3556 [Verrucomicrobiaceae bacterium]|nr:hypothetical protein [Verrucomicrobiaceae bacterium]
MQMPAFYLSRAFVEFGPLTEEEVMTFYQRGILHISDHVRSSDQPGWMPVTEWAAAKSGGPKMTLLPKSSPVKGQGKAA